VLSALGHYCTDLVTICALGGSKESHGRGNLTGKKVIEGADIVVATPARAASHIRAGTLSLAAGLPNPSTTGLGGGGKGGCNLLVIDEADLCLSYGHEEDVLSLVGALPRGFQALMLSATLSPALDGLKRVVLHAPAIVKLEEGPGGDTGGLTQYYLRSPTEDRYLAILTLFRLKLIAGRTIVFTNSIETCYRLKLLLDKFGVVSATLNAELPVRSRASVIEQFNKGIFDILIATDEALEEGEEVVEEEGEDKSGGGEPVDVGKKRVRISVPLSESEATLEFQADQEKQSKKQLKQQQKRARLAPASADPSYGASRGVDFKGVSTVVNFDFPLTRDGYAHRIGRTARGGAAGVALSLLPPLGIDRKGDARLSALIKAAEVAGSPILPLPFDLKEVEGFRYRTGDVLRGLTGAAIQAARMEELRREALSSASLSAYWEDHPEEKNLLAHAKPLSSGRRSGHLKSVPSYLLPPTLRAALQEAGAGVEGEHKGKGKGGRSNSRKDYARRGTKAAKASQFKALSKGGKPVDPLKAFVLNMGRDRKNR